MPSPQEITPTEMATSVLSIAESTTLEGLGRACLSAVHRATGSAIVGFYRVDGRRPQLIYASGVPTGFTAEYSEGLGRADPLVDAVLSDRRAIDGSSLFGRSNWRRSHVYDLLRRWGLHHNMCAPVSLGGTVYGCIYTATRDPAQRYTGRERERMEILCRAGSLALETMAARGALEEAAGGAASDPASLADGAGRFASWLPPRAAEVARRVCLGQPNKLIAREMGISDHTVKEHVAALCRRVGARNRTELAARLARAGRH